MSRAAWSGIGSRAVHVFRAQQRFGCKGARCRRKCCAECKTCRACCAGDCSWAINFGGN